MGYSSSTISTYMSALSYYHKILDVPDSKFVIKMMLTGINNLSKPSCKVRLPIALPILHHLIEVIPSVVYANYLVQLFCAMFAMAFHAFLRVGEYTTQPTSSHVLQLSNIQFTPLKSPKCVIISFSSYKHSPSLLPKLKITSRPSLFCPVRLLFEFIQVRPQGEGSLFGFPDSQPVTSSYLYSIFSQCLLKSGSDPKVYKSHSFRICAATEASVQGFSYSQITALCRW